MFPLQFSDKDDDQNLVDASRSKWKRQRTIINTTFTPSKLKEMVPIINKCVERFIGTIEQNLEKELEVSKYYL